MTQAPPLASLTACGHGHGHRARFWACPANLELFDMTEGDPIPELQGPHGHQTTLERIMSDDHRVLIY
jgi:uncharacterized protein